MKLSQKCKSHSWCTNHDELKYKSYLEKVKQCIESACPEVSIFTNQNPQILLSLLYPDSKPTFTQSPTFPRLGSFEVYFRNKIVFSKLNTGRWPNPSKVSESIRNTLDGVVFFAPNKNTEHFSRPTTSNMNRSRSAKAFPSKFKNNSKL